MIKIFTQDKHYKNMERIAELAEDYMEKTEEIAETYTEKIEEVAESYAEKTDEVTENLMEETEVVAESYTEKTKEITEGYTEKTEKGEESYMEKAEEVAENNIEKSKVAAENCLELLKTHKNEYLAVPVFTVTVQYFYSIATLRYCLSQFSEFLCKWCRSDGKPFPKKWLEVLQTVKQLFNSPKGKYPAEYFIKYIVRQHGMQLFNKLKMYKNPSLDWIIPDHLKRKEENVSKYYIRIYKYKHNYTLYINT